MSVKEAIEHLIRVERGERPKALEKEPKSQHQQPLQGQPATA
jgi:hypothetical protein